MPREPHAVPINQTTLSAARRRHRRRLSTEPTATKVRYDVRRDAVVIEMKSGASLIVPRRLMQGLSEGTPAQLRDVDIGGGGTEIYWGDLDAAFTIMNLLGGIYGSKHWMAEIGRAHSKPPGPKAKAQESRGRSPAHTIRRG